MRLARAVDTKPLSRAFSVRAACADCMAVEVPDLEVPTLGDWGCKGSGGGARSGSELSHLFLLSRRQRNAMRHRTPWERTACGKHTIKSGLVRDLMMQNIGVSDFGLSPTLSGAL